MKIDIITFHFVSNCGGVLQCFAIQQFLEKHGHEVNVIDYRPEYHTIRYQAFKNPFIYIKHYKRQFRDRKVLEKVLLTIRAFARCIFLNLNSSERNVAHLFDTFIRKNLKLTREYTSIEQLRDAPPSADAYVTGSDQLWNPDLLEDKFDLAYFLDFGSESIPRVAYAVSTGKKLNASEIAELNDLCKNLSAISIREYSQDVIGSIKNDIHICIDPTLLLDADDYAPIEAEVNQKEPYIFVYGFEDNEVFHDVIRQVQSRYKAHIINGCPHRIKIDGDVVNIRECGPAEFLGFIKNARCVVTNSFHGTALSIIYKKDFVTLAHSTRGSRMIELLSKLGLSSRLWGDDEFSLEQPIDWSLVEEKRTVLRKNSSEFILSAIEGKRGDEISHIKEECLQVGSDMRVEAYAGSMINKEELRSSASGGAGTAIAKTVIDDGGVVVGVSYAEGFKAAEYVIVEKEEDLYRLKGSKYIPAHKNGRRGMIFENIQHFLLIGRKVLFIGLPCDVGALYSWLNKRNILIEKLITVDLICHGCTTEKVQKQFIDSLEKKFSSSVEKFSTRYVNKTWAIPYVYASFENGKVYKKPLYETDLGFALKYYVRRSCFNCQFKGINHKADITIGDYWGLKPTDPLYKEDGVSVLFVRSSNGVALIDRIDKTMFEFTDVDYEDVVKHNPMYLRSTKKQVFYDTFEKAIINNGLHEAVVHSSGYTVYKKAALKNRILLILGKK